MADTSAKSQKPRGIVSYGSSTSSPSSSPASAPTALPDKDATGDDGAVPAPTVEIVTDTNAPDTPGELDTTEGEQDEQDEANDDATSEQSASTSDSAASNSLSATFTRLGDHTTRECEILKNKGYQLVLDNGLRSIQYAHTSFRYGSIAAVGMWMYIADIAECRTRLPVRVAKSPIGLVERV